MKILHVVPSYYPAVRYGGPIRSVHGLARGLAARGHEVHVYTTNVNGSSNADLPLGVPLDLDGVSVWYFPTALGRRLYRAPGMDRALYMNIGDFDILHTHSVFLWPTTAAARAARKRKVPYVVAPRGMLVASLIRQKSWVAKRAWIAAFERRNLAEAAAVHATSQVEVEDIDKLRLQYKRMIVVSNGTEIPTRITKNYKWVRPTILFLGRVNWKKGLDRLIAAMGFLPEADLVIAGDDDDGYRAVLETLADKLGVASRVHFLGPIHGPDKWSLFASADVFALPSYSENFGNTILEAMAVGCPIVVTREVGSAKIVNDSGCGVVVAGEPEELARSLHSILSDEKRAECMREAGRKTVLERFTWAIIAHEMEQKYQEIVNRSFVGSSLSDRQTDLAEDVLNLI
jgi:glycosyltransferase involved in cell wall biosynthesis